MEKFLHSLAKDIKVDFKSEEIRDIQESVTEYTERILEKIQEAQPIFSSSRIVPCGSMAEGTRIWKFSEDDTVACIEFDFLAILKLFETGSFTVEDSCPGFLEIKNRNSKLPKQYVNDCNEVGTPGKLSSKLLSFDFRLQILKSVTSQCSCLRFETKSIDVQGTEILSLGDVTKTRKYTNECEKCQIKKTTGTLHIASETNYNNPFSHNCSLIFLWKRNTELHLPSPCELTRQEPDIKQEFVIFIDFLPAIELPSTQFFPQEAEAKPTESKSSNPLESAKQYQCFLVPKNCKQEHSTCWKLSHCEFEKQLLRDTSETHRECYMVLKFIQDCILCNIAGNPGIPTTYVLKTSVLYHILECKLQVADLTKCSRQIANLLSDAHQDAFLPHLILKGQNFLAAPSFVEHWNLRAEHLLWSKNRNYIIGRCWLFIFQLLEKINSVLTDGCNFDHIQTFINIAGTMYGSGYRSTTFKTILEPDENELIEVLCCCFNNFESVSQERINAVIKKRECKDFINWDDNLLPQHYIHVYRLFARMSCLNILPEKVKRAIYEEEKSNSEEYKTTIIYSRT